MDELLKSTPPLANNHISVDCVVLGFDGQQLNALLIHRHGDDRGTLFNDMKLPGSLIYEDEDLDEAAHRVIHDLTGLIRIKPVQFRAFGSKDRTSNPRDVLWLERAQNAHVERIVTIAYLALVRIQRTDTAMLAAHGAAWVPVTEIGQLAFDHNRILQESLLFVRQVVESNPAAMFHLLPRKFTAAMLRSLFEVIFGKSIDARNFHKKLSTMRYVVPLDEKESGVAHRAARYYRFDRSKVE